MYPVHSFLKYFVFCAFQIFLRQWHIFQNIFKSHVLSAIFHGQLCSNPDSAHLVLILHR